jgi:hypothetical protein
MFIHYFLGICAAFGAVLAVGLLIRAYWYRRVGYPTTPAFLKKVRFSYDIDTIYRTIEPSIRGVFLVKQRDNDTLVIERTFENPRCVMTIDFFRSPTSSHNRIVVTCHDRPSLNWDSTRSTRYGPKTVKNKTP